MRDEFLVFAAPLIEEAEIQEVVACLRSGWIGTGPRVAEFEREFHSYKRGWGFPAAVNSCTAALHVSLLASGLQPGDEVITSALTFCATINAIIHSGCTPVLADVDPRTMNIDPSSVERSITPRTRAIVPVHFAGRPCDMESLSLLAQRHNLLVIEDCAHALESEYKGLKVGTIGDFGCFSFYVTKNVTTGEGGMILARDSVQAARCRTLALHGLSRDAWQRFGDKGFKHYQVVECGFKYNMMDLQAALGLHQLRKVERCWNRRKEIWERYIAELNGLNLILPSPPESNTRHAYHLFTIRVDPEACDGVTRDQFVDGMTRRNIGVGVHYVSIPEHPYYAERFRWQPAHFPNAWKIGQQTVSLPLSPKLTDLDVVDTIEAVKEIIG